MNLEDIFFIPVSEKFILYAPLHRLTALVNRQALEQIRGGNETSALRPLFERLYAQDIPTPTSRTGIVNQPLFLGLISTRGCNMSCRYCDFAAPKQDSPTMSLDMARDAVDAYFDLLGETDNQQAEIHFFGGEPFLAENVIHFVVEYAQFLASQRHLALRFEATSNGLWNTNRCRWIADTFDTIVLSLDGPPDIQNYHRPGINGNAAADIIIRNARMLSDSPMELVIRACITDRTVNRMPEIARWISQEFRPSTVCFETLSLSHTAEMVDFAPPDPWAFARNFDQASQILRGSGIETVISTADLRAPRTSFCPVGKDALIVSPDGAVDACYLLQKDWELSGLDMRLGSLRDGQFDLSPEAIQRVRHLNVDNKPLCDDCLCRYSCAGGCHVNHDTAKPAGQYDDQCILTRIITVAQLLRQIGQGALADSWLADQAALEHTVWHANDRLAEGVFPS